jgi:hypothetical protein
MFCFICNYTREKVIFLLKLGSMKTYFFIIIFLLFCLTPSISYSVMKGGDFEVYTEQFSVSGGGDIVGGEYQVQGSAGEAISGFMAGVGAGEIYTVDGGFQATERGIVTLDVPTSIDLGQIDYHLLSTTNITVQVYAELEEGVRVFLTPQTTLHKGDPDTDDDQNIDDVADGLVSADAEEYGLRFLNPPGADDVPLTKLQQIELFELLPTETSGSAELQFRASGGQKTKAGEYSQVLEVTAIAL